MRRLAYSLTNPSTGIAAPPVGPPNYDPLKPEAGMITKSSLMGSEPYNRAEPPTGYNAPPTMSESNPSSDGSQELAPQSPAPSASETANPDKLMDMDSEPHILPPVTQANTT
jgi:hypothetical protein